MKIFYIGKFERMWDEEGIARAFEKLGHTVFRCEEGASDNREILRQVDDFKPDFVLWAKLQVPDDAHKLVAELKKLKIKTACWIFDIYIGYPGREPMIPTEACFMADHVFTTDGGHELQWIAKGINHHVLRQGILEEYAQLVKPHKDFPFDVIFVGGDSMATPYRNFVLDKVAKKYGSKFHWYGRFDTNEARGMDLNAIYASAKVIVGDSFYSPNYWSNRIYETLGRGGFLIHPDVAGLSNEFPYYKCLVPYRYADTDGLIEKIDYFLAHDKEREKIRQKGFEKCVDHYTYTDRCKTLINTLLGQ